MEEGQRVYTYTEDSGKHYISCKFICRGIKVGFFTETRYDEEDSILIASYTVDDVVRDIKSMPTKELERLKSNDIDLLDLKRVLYKY